jgi:nitrogen regulatory protein PII
MQLYPLRLVTVVAEGILKEQICKRGLELGATGFTCSEVEGHGSRGARNQDTASGTNVRIEFVVPDSVAEQILTYVSHQHFEHYAVISWVTDVAVVRGKHYIKLTGQTA